MARLSFTSEVADDIAKGVMMPGEFVIPAIVKPRFWLLMVPALLGSLAALAIRVLFVAKDRGKLLAEWPLVTVVAVVLQGEP